MKRIYNFSAGPAMLPEEVLKEAQEEMLDYRGCGMSVMEMSHRSKVYEEIIGSAEKDLRTLLNVPNNYKILFIQGGGTQQFAMVPMNLVKNGVYDYILTGHWSKKAAEEAAMYGHVNVVASSADKNFSYMPDVSDLKLTENADYLYMVENETIGGSTMFHIPDAKGHILVNDASSNFLSHPLDVTKFGLIFAGAQKNVGPAGVVIVIIREDLIKEDVYPSTPIMLKYKTFAENGSMYNTPPCYPIYICGKVFKWLLGIGGLDEMKRRNDKKADLLYNAIDASKLFKGIVAKADRSLMNVTFTTGNEDLDAKFAKEAKAAGYDNLKGHRSVGGLRASIYNAMPHEGVEALVGFMKQFEAATAVK
ncbi:MAG: phosphoserine transaminase [Tenericutes bacterium GWF2_57_13]|nr:MAG: phosphoserine transaminase [Tenericutes bacterium GWF2_57_13]